MNLDNDIGNLFIKTGLFKNIHPNVISIIGIFLNFLILWSIIENKSNHVITILALLRCLTDILDGMVARKYNKKSKLGGWLDTFQDVLLGFFVVPFILLLKYQKNKKITIIIPSILTIISLLICYCNEDSWDHDNIDNDIFQIYRNNTIVLFILCIFLNYKYKLFTINNKSI